MSVSDGEKVNAAVTNAAFVSRTTDSNTTAKVDLENIDAASGASIFNIQKSMNASHSFQGADPNGVENQTPSWTSDTIGTPNEAIKPRVDSVQAQVETNTTGVASNLSDIADIRTTQGTSDGDTDLGTFTGSTISDNTAVKNALQELETAVEAVGGALVYQGTWNASTNTPTLVSATGTAGHFYIVSDAGSTNLDGITDWQPNDWAVFNGTAWQKVDNTELVTSVNGATGAVSLALDDLNNVTEVSIASGDFLRWSGSAWTNSKELDIAGTASLTQRLVVSSDTTANLTSLARKAGAVYWSTDELVYKGDDGTSLISLGSGGGGSGLKNYFDAYGDFEGATDVSANATLFNDPGGYSDGTGGSVAGLSVAQHTGGSVLVNDATLAITKAAVDSSEDGVTFLTRTIDSADFGRALYGSFEFDGTDANYTSGDFAVKAYDVTNSAEIPVVIDEALPDSKGKVVFKVLPSDTTASVRVSLYLESDSATGSAFTVYLDDLRLGPSQILQTAIITKPVAYTPTFTGFGTVSGVNFRYWREGSNLRIAGYFTSGTVTAVEARVSFPSGLTSDSSLPTISHVGEYFREAAAASGSSGGGVLIEPSVGYTTFASSAVFSTSATSALTKTIATASFGASGDDISIDATIPIDGWSAGALLSTTETLFKNTAAKIYLNATQSGIGTSETQILFDTVDFDKTSVFSSSDNGFIIPADGIYHIAMQLSTTGFTGDDRLFNTIRVNGSAVLQLLESTGNVSNGGSNAGSIFELQKGDVVEFYTQATNDVSWGVITGVDRSFATIQAVPDFSSFGVYGEHEIITAESDNFRLDTAGYVSTEWAQLTGNSVELTPGVWELTGYVGLTDTGTNPVVSQVQGRWGDANGDNTGTVPSSASLNINYSIFNTFHDVRTGDEFDLLRIAMVPTIFTVTETLDVFLNLRTTFVSAGDGEVFCGITAKRLQ